MAKQFVGAALVGVAALVCSLAAQAAYTVTMNQVGTDVVATGSGFFNLAGAGAPLTNPSGVGVVPASAMVVIGAAAVVDGFTLPIAGPANFGAGGFALATSGAGPIAGINTTISMLVVPAGYIDGTPLGVATTTWSGQTLAGMGVTPGTYVWTWGAGPTADSFTLIVNAPSPASVPTLAEWGTVFLAAMLALLGFTTLRQRRD